MTDVAKFSYIHRRAGSSNWVYKREVPRELRAVAGRAQIWRSLGTPDRRTAERRYATVHAAIQRQIDAWRDVASGAPVAPTPAAEAATKLSAPVARLITSDFSHRIFDEDFVRRGELWKRAVANPDAFWRGDILPLPDDAPRASHSFMDVLAETTTFDQCFLWLLTFDRETTVQRLRTRYQLGDSADHEAVAAGELAARGLSVHPADARRLARQLLEAEIDTLERIIAKEKPPEPTVAATAPLATPSAPAERMSRLVEPYLASRRRERGWTDKDEQRCRQYLREFHEICGDKPVNAYTTGDGAAFKELQLRVPPQRRTGIYRDLSLTDAAKLADELEAKGGSVPRLNASTINDKLGYVRVFFKNARLRDTSVVNPVDGVTVTRSKRNRKQPRRPWTTDELNKLFSAPIYTGCKSLQQWRKPGDIVPRTSAQFWVPLIGLFTGMRLGEVIQLRVADIKSKNGIDYFDVTTESEDDGDDSAATKSVKTHTSRRGVPIHKTLKDIGLDTFIAQCRASGQARLFPAFKCTKAGSWSQEFGKFFKDYRAAIGVGQQPGPRVDFHSFRHNVEDALRNASGVNKEVRDAIQGHGENGVSANYGTGHYLTTLNDAVQKISYAGVALEHLTVGAMSGADT